MPSKLDFFCQNILVWMYYNIRTQPEYTTRLVKNQQDLMKANGLKVWLLKRQQKVAII